MEIKIETKYYERLASGFAHLLKEADSSLAVSKKTAKYIDGQPLISIDSAAVLNQVNTDIASTAPSFLELLKVGVNLANAIPNCKLVEPELAAINQFVATYRDGQFGASLPFIIYSQKERKFIVSDAGKNALDSSLMILTGVEAEVYQRVADLRQYVRKNIANKTVLNKILNQDVYFNVMGNDDFLSEALGSILLNPNR